MNTEIKHFHLFCGSGAGALGFQRAQARIGNVSAKMRCLGGVDANPAAIADFDMLLGAPGLGTVMDLFDEDQHRDFFGKAPPKGWRPATPEDILTAAGGECPDIAFQSAPCKGFSGLLSGKSARSRKYQALNALTARGMWLMLEAFQDDPVGIYLFENVPRITTRGRPLLDQIKGMLESYGYAVAETVHDCGELGGLAQHRKRFLLVARHRTKVPPFLYEPPKRRVRSIGEVLGALPMPDDPAGGPMHRLPRLQWKTWVRLALISAGKDWRALQELKVCSYQSPGGQSSADVLADYALLPVDTQWNGGVMGVRRWEEPSVTMTGRGSPTCGAFSVADPRTRHLGDYQAYGVRGWEAPSGTVTGQAAPGGGAFSVADPRISRYGSHSGKMNVQDWHRPARTMTGSDRVGSGAACIADPRLNCDVRDVRGRRHNNVYRVSPWEAASPTMTSGGGPSSGGVMVADPRSAWMKPSVHHNIYRVTEWSSPSRTVTSGSRPAAGCISIADPRLLGWLGGRRSWAGGGHYGVASWDAASGAVVGHAKHDRGAFSIADPRLSGLPAPEDRPDPPPIILSLDGTWHRPLTTLECAAIQSFPVELLMGQPLDGTSHTAWRERIGNAVPPDAAQAMGSTIAQTILLARSGSSFMLSASPIWVEPSLAIALAIDTSRSL